jgi:cobalamin synthase
VESEIARAESTLKEYKNVVFTAIPLIIAACALVIMFINKPVWRASMVTGIAMLAIILLIDGMAHARIDAYNKHLLRVEKQEKN